MRVPQPDLVDRRDGSVLLVWGDAPFWIVLDEPAAAYVLARAAGSSTSGALEASGEGSTRQEARELDAVLHRAGVLRRGPRGPVKERIESITVNVTNRCQMRCGHCYNRALAHGSAEIGSGAMIAALEQALPFTAPGALLALLGGEPLLERERTLALADWGRRRGLAAVVSTNGLLVDDAFAHRAAEAALECQVSIDGPDAATHEAIRGHGAFEQAVHAVETLVSKGVRTTISMVVHGAGVGAVPPYLRLARELGVQGARFIPVKQVGCGGSFAAPDPVGLIQAVADTLNHEPQLAALLGRDYVGVLARTCTECCPRRSCGAGSQTFQLDADGTVYACPNLAAPGLACGSVLEQPFDRIWRKSAGLAALRAETGVLQGGGVCSRCSVRHWCLGGCRGEAYQATGRLGNLPPACEQLRAAVVEMFWTVTRNMAVRRLGTGEQTAVRRSS